jgi:16S rRNA (cytosine1402-N4)-methyltransferase
MNATMSSGNLEHFPVMLDKILSIITPQHGGTFIDCTFGAGGYTKAILNFPNTKVIAIDRDQSVNSYAQLLIRKYNKRLKFYNNKFSQIDNISEATKSVKAIILDLGFSMFQMKNLSRGFSFNSKGPLDMRMGFNYFGANEVINKLEQKEIELILKYFGDEKYNKKIAFQITNLRRKKKIDTQDLVKIINKVKKKNPIVVSMKLQNHFKL